MAVYTVSVLRHGERGIGNHEQIGRLWRSFEAAYAVLEEARKSGLYKFVYVTKYQDSRAECGIVVYHWRHDSLHQWAYDGD